MNPDPVFAAQFQRECREFHRLAEQFIPDTGRPDWLAKVDYFLETMEELRRLNG